MNDTSYVNLSLEKYNELYDKAKKFDELTDKLGNNIAGVINNVMETFKTYLDECEEPVEEEIKEDK